MLPDAAYARGDEGWVAYQVIGEGPIDVLVTKSVHFPVDLMWDDPGFVRLAEGLGSFSRSIWFDLRGSGASDATEHVEGRLIESMVDDMITVLDEVGSAQVSVVGLIGVPAVLFAATHPNRTRALVLVNPVAGPPAARPDDRLRDWREAWGTGRFVAGMTPSRAGDKTFLRWCARCERLAMTPAESYWRLRASLEVDVRPVLSAIRVPTLVICARDAPMANASRDVADQIDGARFVEIDSSDLMVLGTDTGAVIDPIEEFLTGRLPTHVADRMLATVMFTDVVRSTETLAQAGDRRWRDLLAAHDHLVRAELARFGGREIKATGDGFVATFDGPGRSIRCGIAIRDQLRSLGLDVRVGLHTGEIEHHGHDITGIAVHIAQRIQSLAQPGEVLVSRTVVDLVAGSGLDFIGRGTHTLKGVPGDWTLYTPAF